MTNLLRPNQIDEMRGERESLSAALQNPHVQDKGTVVRQLRKLEHQLETQTPRPYQGKEIDAAVVREKELREQLLVGMPSQEEMRKSPPGAVGKHMDWEKRNKRKLMEWKAIQLRLNHESKDPDIANFERFRPTRSTLNMDNAHIPGQTYFMPSEAYKENYDNVFGKPEGPKEPKRPTISAEERERRRQRMLERHAARKAAAAEPAPEAPPKEE